uniref:Polyurethanase lipase A n=1 Tax=Pseudomonas fluorescens TaxID=294 RepID=Q9LAB9_PSEFL|nr:polyurethanase lipase A [Pseudomonas fluorescens]
MAITLYSYHNLDNGFAVGYQNNGLGLGLPATLVSALIGGSNAQGVIPGIPWNPDSEKPALEAVQAAGWTPISASTLGYTARSMHAAPTLAKNSATARRRPRCWASTMTLATAGNRHQFPRHFRASGKCDHRLHRRCDQRPARRLRAQGLCQELRGGGFWRVAQRLADTPLPGLGGNDVVVSGHSLGGMAVNSMADLSDSTWSGFYKDANYLAYASPTQSAGDKVLNVGYENDPVFRALDGSSFNLSSLGVHDKAHESSTDNIVSLNDHYASSLWNVLPFSILNLPTWVSHLPTGYGDGMTRILDSGFYEQMTRDSTVIVANLSDPARATTWVQDLNRNAEAHKGNTFIIGSDGDDFIKGGRGADFIEGGKGNDTIRDSSGHNTFLFSGQFGNDRVIGYQATDKLVFNDVAGSTDYRDHVKVVGGDTVIGFGTDSVTLVGVSSLSGEGIVIS